MKDRIARALSVLVVLALGGPVLAAVTSEALLDEMTDLSRLASLPDPGYVTRQFSSYDQRSKTPDDADAWFANGDSGKYLRTEKVGSRTEYVMMDADGPGAIVRIWSANPMGTLRIYIDGAAEPVLAEPMPDLLSGKTKGLPEPVAGARARGFNLYFPFTYAKHCKVTSDEGKFYYHVNYRTYPAGTEVESFKPGDVAKLADRTAKVAAALKTPRTAVEPAANAAKKPFDVSLAPGQEAAAVELADAAAICAMSCTLAAKDVTAAARGVVLTITFDGEKTVECPLGDFFGTAPGLNAFESLPMGMTKGDSPTMWCHWVMPFARSAKVTLKNFSESPAQLKGEVATVPFRWGERSLLFHGKWRIQRDLPSRPFSDWNHLDCTGQGRFVGGALHVINPVKAWWGEGDEKIYVDGEKFPSHFGTGSEDYYGYAWCSNILFTHAYHNQPRCDGPGNFGHTSVSRFHIIDDIPFAKSFRFDMENWHSRDNVKTTRAAVSYWYARPGGADAFKPLTAADVAAPPEMTYTVRHVEGAIEAESLKPDGAAKCRIVDMDDRFSGEKQLLWEKGKPGDKLVLGFDAAAAGSKKVVVQLVRGAGSARVQLYVNDKKAGEPVDLYAARTAPTKELDLGSLELAKGRNTLTVEILDANAKAAKKYEVGIDYLRVE